MNQRLIFSLLIVFILLQTGCIIDKWFAKDNPVVATSSVYYDLNGTVKVASGGAFKIRSKAPVSAMVYLLPGDIDYSEILNFKVVYLQVTTTDRDGNYEFKKVEKGKKYIIIIDSNKDGILDNVLYNLDPETYKDTNIDNYIRETGTSSDSVLNIACDKTEYGYDEKMTITVSGYCTATYPLHVEIWNEKNGKHIWSSSDVSIKGNVSKSFTYTVSQDLPATNSTLGADFRVYVSLDTTLGNSTGFSLQGAKSGDTTPPSSSSIVINSGAATTINATVTLTLSSQGATQMQINNSSDFSNIAWITYTTSKSWTLSSGVDGTRTVYVNFADSAGNKSSTYSDSILLDTTSPAILSSVVEADNSFITLTMSEGVYNTNGGSGAIEKNLFTITFEQNGGSATGATIDSISQADGLALAGGETVIKINLTVNGGSTNAVETIEIKPVNGNSIFDIEGQPMASSQTTGKVVLNDEVNPDILSATISAANNYVEVTMSEGIYGNASANSAIEKTDLTLTSFDGGPVIDAGIADLRNSTGTLLSGGEKIIRVMLNFTGTVSGTERYFIQPFNGASVYDKVGNAMGAGATSGNFYLNGVPEINSGILASNNTYVDITFNEKVYSTNSGSGALAASDFYLTFAQNAGGAVTAVSIASVSKTDENPLVGGETDVRLILTSSGGPATGDETIEIKPASDSSIFDEDGMFLVTSENTGALLLKDERFPMILSGTMASDNTYIDVIVSEGVYSDTGPANPLIKADFEQIIFVQQNGDIVTDVAISSVKQNDNIVEGTASALVGGETTIRVFLTVTNGPSTGDATIAIKPVDGIAIYGASNNLMTNTQTTGPVSLIDETPSTVSNVTSTDTDGTYITGNSLNITIEFDEIVNVTGTPQLELKLDVTNRIINYSSGSGSTTLTFIYNITQGDDSSDLAYVDANSLTFNTGTITDTAGNIATLTLEDPGDPNSLSDNKALVIDTTSPIITNVSSGKTPGPWTVGEVIDIDVTFNDNVTVTGIPQLYLDINSGAIDYISGTGTAVLTFRLTVASGDDTTDLAYVDGNSLKLNSGTITDIAGNNATLTLFTPGDANSLSSNNDIAIDTSGPFVVNVSSTEIDGSYNENDNIDIKIEFNEIVVVTAGTPQLTLGDNLGTVNYSGGTGNKILTFTYDIDSNDNSSKLKYFSTSSFALNGGQIKDSLGNDAVLTLFTPGTANSLSANKTIVIDTTKPKVKNVTSTTNNGIYKSTNEIVITIEFDEVVYVTNTPQLTLDINTGTIDYTSGDGTTTLTFTYTVGANDDSTDLAYVDANSLALNTGTINDKADNTADLDLPTPGTVYSLSYNKALVIDNTKPTVTNVTSIKANGSYNVDEVIDILVEFSEIVTVTGTPQLTLEVNNVLSGRTDYVSGTGTNTIKFRYTVIDGDDSADLDYAATDSLYLNGGTIKDAVGNNATLTLPAPTDPNSLSSNKNILISTTAPYVENVTSVSNGTYSVDEEIVITVEFNKIVNVTGTPQLELDVTTGKINYVDGSGTTILTFTYIVGSSDNSTDLAYVTQDPLTLNSGTIKDINNNIALLTLPTPGDDYSLSKNKNIVIDNTGPTVIDVTSGTAEGTYTETDIIYITVEFSDVVIVAGTPQLTLGDSIGPIDCTGGTGTTTLTFTYTVGSGQNSTDLDYASTTALDLNSGSIKDVAGNAAFLTLVTPGTTGSLGKNKDFIIDNTAPTVVKVSSPDSNGTYKTDDTIDITIQFSEIVDVDESGGTPSLDLDINSSAISYVSGTGSDTLIFGYTVIAGDDSSDLDYIDEDSLILNSGTIKDGVAIDAILKLATPGESGSLGAEKNLVIDTTSPKVINVTSNDSDGTYNIGKTLYITVEFDDIILVTNTPQLILSDSIGPIDYYSGSNSTTLTFKYIVSDGDDSSDLGYFDENSLIENTGTIKDSSGNDADLTLVTPGDEKALSYNKNINIDGYIPVVTNCTSTTTADGSYTVGEIIDITVYFDTAVIVSGTPRLRLETGYIYYISGSNSTALIFQFEVTSGQNSTNDLSYVATNSLGQYAGSTMQSVSGNDASLTLATPGDATSLSANKNIFIDTTAPTIVNVTALPTGGIYNLGDGPIIVSIQFSETVLVDETFGTPQLSLDDGIGGIDYTSGSNTNILNFTYVIGATDNSLDLAYASTTALALIGGTILDDAGNAAVLTLASPGTVTSLSYNEDIVIDNTAPTVVNVTSTKSNGTYRSGEVIDITIEFSELVNVTNPQLTLDDGIGIIYGNSISGSQIITLTYTVDGDDNTLDLKYTDDSLVGTITDLTGNAATLALPNPGTAGSISANKAIVIDNVSPTVINVTSTKANGTYGIGENFAITVQFSKIVEVTGLPQLELADSIGNINYSSGSGTDTLIFSYTVALDQNSDDLAYVDTSSLTFNSGTIKDVIGNNATLTLKPSGDPNSLKYNKAIKIDGTKPTILSITSTSPNTSYGLASNINVTVTFSENVTLSAGGAISITLDTGDIVTIYSFTSSTTAAANYFVSAGRNSTDLDSTNLVLSSGTLQDDVGNAATVSWALIPTNIATGSAIVVDTAAPTITATKSNAGFGPHGISGTIDVDVVFDEPVILNGTLQVTLNTGATVNITTFGSPNGLTEGSGIYTVAAGQNTPDLDSTGITLSSGTLKDPAGNDVIISHPANSIADTNQIEIVGTASSVTSITSNTGNGIYTFNDTINVLVNFTTSVTLTGSITVTLDTGGTATITSFGPATSATGVYTVAANHNSADLDAVGIVLTGTLVDGALNPVSVSLPGTTIANGSDIVIDNTAPNGPTGVTLTPIGGTIVANTLNSTNTNMTAYASIVAGQATGGSAELLIDGNPFITPVMDNTILVNDTTVTFDLGLASTVALQTAVPAGGVINVRVTDSMGFSTDSTIANPTLLVDYIVPDVPTAVTLTIIGGNVFPDALNNTNTNMSAVATITADQAVDGAAELLIDGASFGTPVYDVAIGVGEVEVQFDLGAGSTSALQFAVQTGGVISVGISDPAGNTSVSTVLNPTLSVNYTPPTAPTSIIITPIGGTVVNNTLNETNTDMTVVATIIDGNAIGGYAELLIDGSSFNTPLIDNTIIGGDTTVDFNIGTGNNPDLQNAVPSGGVISVQLTDSLGNISVSTSNPTLIVDYGAPTPPTAVTLTTVGGTIITNTLNGTNTNMTAVATITPGEATGGVAELLIDGASFSPKVLDNNILVGDTSVTFDLGTGSNPALKIAVPAGGVISVRITDSSLNFSNSTGNPTLVVDYIAPDTPTSVIITPVGGTVVPDTLNDTNTNMTAIATIVGGQATGGQAELLIGGNSFITPVKDLTIGDATDTQLDFDLGLASTNALQAAVPSGGDISVIITDTAGNSSTSTVTTLVVSYTAPNAPTAVTLYPIGATIVANTLNSTNTNMTADATITAGQAGGGTAELLLGGISFNPKLLDNIINGGDTTVTFDFGTANPAALQTAIPSGGVFSVRLSNSLGSSSISTVSNPTLVVDYTPPDAPTNVTVAATGGTVVTDTLNSTNTNMVATATITLGQATSGYAELLIGGNSFGTQVFDSSIFGVDTNVQFDLGLASNVALKLAVPAGDVISVQITDTAGNVSVSTVNNPTLTVDYVAPDAPTVVTVTPVGGTVIADTLNVTNTNMTAVATITANQAVNGSAELLIGDLSFGSQVLDNSINDGETQLQFDLGLANNGALQAAVPSGGFISVILTDVEGNSVTSTVNNPLLVVDYTVPTAPTAVTLTPIGGLVGTNVLNATNTNMTAVATIIPGEVNGGTAELLVDGVSFSPPIIDNSIASGDITVTFDVGATNTAELQTAVPEDKSGVISVKITNTLGSSAESIPNPTLLVDYTPPTAPTNVILTPVSGTIVADTLNGTNTNLTAFATITPGEAANGAAELLINGIPFGTPVYDLAIGGGEAQLQFDLGLASTVALQTAVPTGNVISVRVTDAVGNISISTVNNPTLVVDYVAPNAPTAVTLIPVGGTIVTDTLNTTNTNMNAAASITAGQATGGTAELIIGVISFITPVNDVLINGGDTQLQFDLGLSNTVDLQNAVPAGGVISVTVTDTAGNSSTSTVSNPTLVVDYVNPTVQQVSSAMPNGSYGAGIIIDVTVQFDEVVTSVGTSSRLIIDTGGIFLATYQSGSGSNTFVYRYIVQQGDISGDLDYTSTTALELAGSAIRDAAGNDAILTLDAPGTGSSLGANKIIIIDTVLPTIDSGVIGPASAYIDVTFSTGCWNTNGATGALDTSDFWLTFRQHSPPGTATNCQMAGITKTTGGVLTGGETTVRILLSVTGAINGLAESVEITPVDGASIFNTAGNAMSGTETTTEVELIP